VLVAEKIRGRKDVANVVVAGATAGGVLGIPKGPAGAARGVLIGGGFSFVYGLLLHALWEAEARVVVVVPSTTAGAATTAPSNATPSANAGEDTPAAATDNGAGSSDSYARPSGADDSATHGSAADVTPLVSEKLPTHPSRDVPSARWAQAAPSPGSDSANSS
jgi:hypothetical protein